MAIDVDPESIVRRFYLIICPHTKGKSPYLATYPPGGNSVVINLELRALYISAALGVPAKVKFRAERPNELEAKLAVNLQVLDYLEQVGILPNDWRQWPRDWEEATVPSVLRFLMLTYLLNTAEGSWVGWKSVLKFNAPYHSRPQAGQVLRDLLNEGLLTDNGNSQLRLATVAECDQHRRQHNLPPRPQLPAQPPDTYQPPAQQQQQQLYQQPYSMDQQLQQQPQTQPIYQQQQQRAGSWSGAAGAVAGLASTAYQQQPVAVSWQQQQPLQPVQQQQQQQAQTIPAFQPAVLPVVQQQQHVVQVLPPEPVPVQAVQLPGQVRQPHAQLPWVDERQQQQQWPGQQQQYVQPSQQQAQALPNSSGSSWQPQQWQYDTTLQPYGQPPPPPAALYQHQQLTYQHQQPLQQQQQRRAGDCSVASYGVGGKRVIDAHSGAYGQPQPPWQYDDVRRQQEGRREQYDRQYNEQYNEQYNKRSRQDDAGYRGGPMYNSSGDGLWSGHREGWDGRLRGSSREDAYSRGANDWPIGQREHYREEGGYRSSRIEEYNRSSRDRDSGQWGSRDYQPGDKQQRQTVPQNAKQHQPLQPDRNTAAAAASGCAAASIPGSVAAAWVVPDKPLTPQELRKAVQQLLQAAAPFAVDAEKLKRCFAAASAAATSGTLTGGSSIDGFLRRLEDEGTVETFSVEDKHKGSVRYVRYVSSCWSEQVVKHLAAAAAT